MENNNKFNLAVGPIESMFECFKSEISYLNNDIVTIVELVKEIEGCKLITETEREELLAHGKLTASMNWSIANKGDNDEN